MNTEELSTVEPVAAASVGAKGGTRGVERFRLLSNVIRRRMAWASVPLGIFLLSRLGLLLFTYLSLILIPVQEGRAGQHWTPYPPNLLVDGWTRWDSGWYWSIADKGYRNDPSVRDGAQKDTAFFPLYPLLVRAVRPLFRETHYAALAVSNLAFLAALILLHRLVLLHYDAAIARRSLVLLAVHPFSLYFSAMYAESLYLALVLAAFYTGERKRWFWASVFAALAGAARLPGILVMLGLGVLYLEQVDFDWRKVRPDIAWILLGLAGLGGFMVFLGLRFGDPFLYIRSHFVPGWGPRGGIRDAFRDLAQACSLQNLSTGNYKPLNLMHLGALFVALGLSLYGRGRPRTAYAIWSCANIGIAGACWGEMGRYVVVLFPTFISAAVALKNEASYRAVLYFSVLLLALFTLMYSHWQWVA